MTVRAFRDGYNRTNLHIGPFEFSVVSEPWDGPTATMFVRLPRRRFMVLRFSWKLAE